MEEWKNRQYTDNLESAMQGTGRTYRKTGKTLGAALINSFQQLKIIILIHIFWDHQYWDLNRQPFSNSNLFSKYPMDKFLNLYMAGF